MTVALVGSSGAGKSTLVNALLGEERMRTGEVRASDGRGCHVTTHRQLVLLPGGGLLLDTPGMRELQLVDDDGLANRLRGHRGARRTAVAFATAATTPSLAAR